MHPYDRTCRWCGHTPTIEIVDGLVTQVHLASDCRLKPPLTADEGAAALGGLLLMAMAIRENAPRVVERSYWTKLEGLALYDDLCSDCGVQIKTLGADQDGTDNEWCECDE